MNRPRLAPFQILLFVLIFLFCLEALVMAFINYLQLPPAWEAILDAAALMLLALPVLYTMFFRPLVRQYQATDQAHTTIQTLYATSTELSQNLDLSRIAAVLTRQMKILVPADSVVISLRDPGGQTRFGPAGGETAAGQAYLARLPANEARLHPALMSVLNEAVSQAISDVTALPDWQPSINIRPGKSWMGIPLIAHGSVLGLCEITHPEPGVFTTEHVRLAEGLAGQAAAAIQNACLYDQVRTAHAQLQHLTREIVVFQEHERRYLAKALYDEVGQCVAAVMLHLRELESLNLALPEVQDRIGAIEAELDQISQRLHELANDLRPASLDFLGLPPALNQLACRVQAQAVYDIQVQIGDLPGRLPEVSEIVLFRIAQEALTNVTRHAQATHVRLGLSQAEGCLELVIEDDGCGFSLENVDPSRCFGLLDMRERAEMLGGKLAIDSAPSAGTRVQVLVPLPSPDFASPETAQVGGHFQRGDCSTTFPTKKP